MKKHFYNKATANIGCYVNTGPHAAGAVEISSEHHSSTAECSHFWQTARTRMPSNLEAKAALSLSIYVLPMWLFHFSQALYAFTLFWCLKFGFECKTLMGLNVIEKNVYLLYSLYNPIMYAATSREFRRAFGWLCKKKVRRSTDILS